MNYKFKNFPATCVLIGINVAIYLLMTFAGGSQNPGVLVRFGANFAPYVSNGEYWRLLTAMFLHIGLEHLALNMLTLYFIGASLEPILGSVRFVVLYLVSGICGDAASYSLTNGLSAGASTALFGLFGAYLMLGESFGNNAYIKIMARQFLLLVILNIFFDFFSSGIDIWGHIGGLLSGFLFGYVIGAPKLGEIPVGKRVICAMAILMFLLVMFKSGFVY